MIDEDLATHLTPSQAFQLGDDDWPQLVVSGLVPPRSRHGAEQLRQRGRGLYGGTEATVAHRVFDSMFVASTGWSSGVLHS